MEGYGTEKVIEAIHRRAGKIPVLVVPVKLVATLITHAFGGSAGEEGPCARIGVGLTSLFSALLKFLQPLRLVDQESSVLPAQCIIRLI